jgi:hypothetical protein
MPQNVTDNDTWTATVQCQADGDAVDGTNCLVPAQDLADRSRYLYNRTPAASGGAYQVPICPVDFGAVARWAWLTTSNGWYCANIGGADEMVIPLPALIDTTFDSVTMILHGDANGAGPHGGAIGTMPRITLYRIDGALGTFTNVGSQIDTTVAPATYDVLHSVTLSVAAQTVDSTTQYAVSIRGESGANSIAGALVMFGLHMNIVPA